MKIKLRRNPISEKIWTFKNSKWISLKNGKWEEFFLFIRILKMMLEASETLTDNATLQYLLTVLHGKALRKLKSLCLQIGRTTVKHLNQDIFDLGKYFTPVNEFSKQKCVICHGMRNT